MITQWQYKNDDTTFGNILIILNKFKHFLLFVYILLICFRMWYVDNEMSII